MNNYRNEGGRACREGVLSNDASPPPRTLTVAVVTHAHACTHEERHVACDGTEESPGIL